MQITCLSPCLSRGLQPKGENQKLLPHHGGQVVPALAPPPRERDERLGAVWPPSRSRKQPPQDLPLGRARRQHLRRWPGRCGKPNRKRALGPFLNSSACAKQVGFRTRCRAPSASTFFRGSTRRPCSTWLTARPSSTPLCEAPPYQPRPSRRADAAAAALRRREASARGRQTTAASRSTISPTSAPQRCRFLCLTAI